MYEVMDLFGLINTDEFGNKSYSDEAVEFATQILDTMNDVKDHFKCDFTFNIEMIPAENCAGVICTADNLLYEQNKYFIYSNQWIPLMEKCTIQEKCRLGHLFDAKCGGGCIAHIDIENRFPNEEAAWDMLNYVAKQGVIYFAFTTKITFTGNRFEFRAPGSSCNCSMPLIVINTAVAAELQDFCDAVNSLLKEGVKKDEAILKVIRQFITASRKIRFEGNGYSEDWIKEAAERGLRSASKATEAFKEYLRPESVELFARFNVLNETELNARYEIKNEIFLKKVQIESRVIADMAANHIIPTAIRYQNVLIENIKGIKEVFPDELGSLAKDEISTLREIIERP